MARNDANHGTGPRTTGKVARTVADKGFGFIRSDDDGKEYFFHLSNCATGVWDAICQGKNGGKGYKVTFEPTMTEKGIRAISVQAPTN